MHARRSARVRPDHVIEGRATVIERRPAASARPAAAPPAAPALPMRPINDNLAGLAPYRHPRPASPDLVFQGSPRWSKRPAAPRRAETRAHPAPAASDEAARQKASVGVMVAVVATLAAWSAPDLHRPAAQPAHSTHGAQSATTSPSGPVSGSGKGDRITFGK